MIGPTCIPILGMRLALVAAKSPACYGSESHNGERIHLVTHDLWWMAAR